MLTFKITSHTKRTAAHKIHVYIIVIQTNDLICFMNMLLTIPLDEPAPVVDKDLDNKVEKAMMSSNTTKKNGGESKTSKKKSSIADDDDDADFDAGATTSNGGGTKQGAEWEEVKKARNRINSQRTRERERAQIKSLEAERARLWLSNDAIKFQNQHYREAIGRILEVREMQRNGGGVSSNNNNGVGSSSSNSSIANNSSAQQLAASLGQGGGNATVASMQAMRQQGMMNGMNGLDPNQHHGGLFGSSRGLPTSTPNFNGLSDADLLARHQATTLEMQNMMRQQAGAMGGNIGGLNGLNGMNGMNGNIGGMGGRMVGNNPSVNSMNNMNGMNNRLGVVGAPSNNPYGDVSDNIRIRQLMMQHSATAANAGDFEPNGMLSSLGGGGGGQGLSQQQNNNNNMTVGGESLEDDIGNGLSDADLLQISKRQKFGY
jgi:hypothetical protein